MPTLSEKQVQVLPMRTRTAMTLEELRDAMAQHPADYDSLTGGWASMDNAGSNLGGVAVAPPLSTPVITPAAGNLPRMLRARFYFWAAPPARLAEQPGYDPHAVRPLRAIDVIVTDEKADQFGLVFSSRSRQLLMRNDGVVKSLQKILQSRDATIKIDYYNSHLELHDTDIFLWLTVQRRDNPSIAPDLRLDLVSGISGRDASSRTADLRVSVDFDRPNFLTAVAEADTLGPIEISFVQFVGADPHSYLVKVHVDGGFELRLSNLHRPDSLHDDDPMLTASLTLAYDLIPRINELYKADAESWETRRIEVIEAAMEDLAERYRSAREALQERIHGSPQVPGPDPLAV